MKYVTAKIERVRFAVILSIKNCKQYLHLLGLSRGSGSVTWPPNWVPMLEQRINERTINSVFPISVKTTLFAVFSDKLPLFTALLILTTLNNEWFFSITTWKTDHFLQNLYFSYPKRWQRYALPKKYPFSLFSGLLGSKRLSRGFVNSQNMFTSLIV